MIQWVVEKLVSILPTLAEAEKDKRELADSALSAVSKALTETSIYVRRFSKSGEREPETQERLAHLWAQAAIPLRHIDQELASICQYKSEYWVDPNSWNPEMTNGISIQLEDVGAKYREMLN